MLLLEGVAYYKKATFERNSTSLYFCLSVFLYLCPCFVFLSFQSLSLSNSLSVRHLVFHTPNLSVALYLFFSLSISLCLSVSRSLSVSLSPETWTWGFQVVKSGEVILSQLFVPAHWVLFQRLEGEGRVSWYVERPLFKLLFQYKIWMRLTKVF